MSVDTLSSTLSALADPTRRGILARLAAGDLTVGELAAPYDMSLAAVSKHLTVLEAAGLISRRRDAQFRHCHLEAAPLEAVAAWVGNYQQFWERNLDSLGTYLGTLARKRRGKPRRK
jgi:DNA-binding transcriptional ArsR family regulator